VVDADVHTLSLEDRFDVGDGGVGAPERRPEKPHERPMVRVVDEPRPAVVGDVVRLDCGLDERGVPAGSVEHDRHLARMLGGDRVDHGVDDVGRGFEDVERRPIERLVAEQPDAVVGVGEDRPLELRELFVADDGDSLRLVDLVVGELAGRRPETHDGLHDGLSGGIVVGVALEHRLDAALMLPTLENVPHATAFQGWSVRATTPRDASRSSAGSRRPAASRRGVVANRPNRGDATRRSIASASWLFGTTTRSYPATASWSDWRGRTRLISKGRQRPELA